MTEERQPDRNHPLVLAHQIGSLDRGVREGFKQLHERLNLMDQRLDSLEEWRIEVRTEERVVQRMREAHGEELGRKRDEWFSKSNLLIAAVGVLATIALVLTAVHA